MSSSSTNRSRFRSSRPLSSADRLGGDAMTEVRPRLAFDSFTFADIERFSASGNRYEIIDGFLWMTADRDRHAGIRRRAPLCVRVAMDVLLA